MEESEVYEWLCMKAQYIFHSSYQNVFGLCTLNFWYNWHLTWRLNYFIILFSVGTVDKYVRKVSIKILWTYLLIQKMVPSELRFVPLISYYRLRLNRYEELRWGHFWITAHLLRTILFFSFLHHPVRRPQSTSTAAVRVLFSALSEKLQHPGLGCSTSRCFLPITTSQ